MPSLCFMCNIYNAQIRSIQHIITEYTRISVVNFFNVVLEYKCNNEWLLCSICLEKLNKLDLHYFVFEKLKKGFIDTLKVAEEVNGSQLVINQEFQDNDFGTAEEHKPKVNNKCEECNINLTTKEELKKHKCEKPNKGKECEVNISNEQLSKQELNIHNKSIKCDINLSTEELSSKEHNKCREFDTNLSTEGGFKHKSNELKKHNKLQECDINLSTKEELKIYKSKENNKLQFICHIIKPANSQNKNLEICKQQNPGTPFTCPLCGKSFTQKIALERHMPLHTGELPHQCELCGKRFGHHSSLNAHKRSHAGVKNYKCSACDRCFINVSHLNRHVKTHTGSKQFECDICKKRFAEKYNLSAHRKIHNMENNKVLSLNLSSTNSTNAGLYGGP